MLLYLVNNSIAQLPVWPLASQWNQINCTFAERHSAFHSAIDINCVANDDPFNSSGQPLQITSTEFNAILDGIVRNNAANSINFFEVYHDIQNPNNIETNLKKVRYRDQTDPLLGIFGIPMPSIVISGQNIGKVTDGGHLHFEMWIRDCSNTTCPWRRVDPLNNPEINYTNRPPGYNDIWPAEISDVIFQPVTEPVGTASSYVIANSSTYGLYSFHENSLKVIFETVRI
ncbi:MAG: hypothetical protein WAS72_01475 [Saprospiraceae bacterium]